MIEKVSKKTKKILPIINLPARLFFHVPKEVRRIDYRNLKEILVIFYAGIGDAIMNLPFLTILKKNCPKARITLVCSKGGSEIVNKTHLVDRVEVVDLTLTRQIRDLSKKIRQITNSLKKINDTKYDIAIEPRGDIRCIYFMHWCNAVRKVSYNYTGGESMLTDVVIPSEKTTHLIEDQLYLLKWLGISYSSADAVPTLELIKDDLRKNLKFLNENRILNKTIIGIHPGASWETKRWKYYAELVQKIGEICDEAHFLVFKARGEGATADEVYSSIKSHGLNGQIVSESVSDYIRIIQVCNLMICNDSGSAHISAAYGIPTVVLFGPFEPSYCKPIGKKGVYTISHNLACKPCMSRNCKTSGNECLNGITVDEVLGTVEMALMCEASIRVKTVNQ